MFTDAEKAIFKYHDGAQPRCGDPTTLRRRLIQRLGDPGAVVAKINAGTASKADLQTVLDALGASEQLIEGVRDVFGMQPFDGATGQGATDAMVLGVARAFFRSCATPASDAALPPSSSPSTASTSATPTPASAITATTSA